MRTGAKDNRDGGGGRTGLRAAVCAVLLAASLFAASPAADAGIIDRVKDIYNTPEKLDELQAEYEETRQEFERQKAAFERERESLKQQNEALAAQNETLRERVAVMERDADRRADYTRTAIYSAAGVIGLLLLYAISVRVWRYRAWRRQRPAGGGEG